MAVHGHQQRREALVNLSLAIIKALSLSPRALTVEVIHGCLPSILGSKPTLTDLGAEMEKLEAQGYVKGTAAGLRGTVWKETPEGRLQLE